MEETSGKIEFWDGHESKTKEMTWCNDSDDDRALQIITPTPKENSNVLDPKTDEIRTITCPSCGHDIDFQDQVKYFNFCLCLFDYYYYFFNYLHFLCTNLCELGGNS